MFSIAVQSAKLYGVHRHKLCSQKHRLAEEVSFFIIQPIPVLFRLPFVLVKTKGQEYYASIEKFILVLY